MSPFSEHVATEIRVWMARRHMNQGTLAERIGRDQTWVSKRLSGTTAISLDDLDAVATALEVEPAKLLPRKDSNLQPAGMREVGYETDGYPLTEVTRSDVTLAA